MTEPKLRVENLEKHFPVNKGIVAKMLNRGENKFVQAVDGISFEVQEGESFGFAGESGCGKTTAGKAAIQLLEPTGGSVFLDGEDITEFSADELRDLRRKAQIVHQDPYESINPRFSVYDWVAEPLIVHEIGTRKERAERVYEMLEKVQLEPVGQYVDKFPANLSGGERQRVAIARALILEPTFLLADEPASMLDVSIRARVLDLFKELQADMGLTTVYISHDLSLLKYVCDRIAIMYLGQIVEVGPTDEIINNPKHPYTQALVASVPRISAEEERDDISIAGKVPDPVDIPDQCRFYDRCPEAHDACTTEEPRMYEMGATHEARCVLYDEEIQDRRKLDGVA